MSGFTYKSRIALLFIAVTQFSVGSLLIGSNANPYVDEWQDLKAGMFTLQHVHIHGEELVDR